MTVTPPDTDTDAETDTDDVAPESVDRLSEAAALLQRLLGTPVAIAHSAADVLSDDAAVTTANSSHSGRSLLAVRDGIRRIVVPTGPAGAVLVCEWPADTALDQSAFDILRLIEVIAGGTSTQPATPTAGSVRQGAAALRVDELEHFADQTITARHHTFALERTLEDLIRSGDQAGLAGFLAERPIDINMSRLSPRDALRSQKDIAICLITIATRSASDGGLTVGDAFNLSDSYIRHLEESDSADAVTLVIENALLDLVRRVADVREAGVPSLVRRSESYITHNLQGDVTTAAVARHVGVRPHYLAQLFRTELGQSLSQYANTCRIEAAQHLLLSSDLRLIEICARLGFYDQSHFTRTFKKMTGTTPRRFREAGVPLL